MATKLALGEDLDKAALQRLRDAFAQKRHFDRDMREAYFFSAPERSMVVVSSAKQIREQDLPGDLNTSIGMEESENFSTTLISSFMPEGLEWVKLEAAVEVPETLVQEVDERAAEHVTTTFQLLQQSNFYAELATALNPDGAVGTFGLWIDEGRRAHDPIHVQAVPLREMDLNYGPDGSIDTRFITRHTKHRFVKSLVPKDAVLPREVEDGIKNQPDAAIAVRWGFWRCWERLDDVVWHYVVMVRDKVVWCTELVGEGSCPFVAPTFNRAPDTAYGSGPLIKALPELRQIDALQKALAEGVDQTVRPTMTYPDDGFASIEGGVEPGTWMPIRPGTEDAVKPMFPAPKLDPAYFDHAARERRIKKLFYNDFPEQRADTPPTATQWVDEMAMAQRKIGTPGLKFWRECPREIFLRFYFLAKKRGLVQPVKVKGVAEAVSLAPYNPTQRAQDSQKVANALRAGQAAASLWPEEFKAAVDGTKTSQNIFRLMGANDVIVMREAKDVQQAVGMVSQLMGGGQAPAAPPMGMPGAPPA